MIHSKISKNKMMQTHHTLENFICDLATLSHFGRVTFKNPSGFARSLIKISSVSSVFFTFVEDFQMYQAFLSLFWCDPQNASQCFRKYQNASECFRMFQIASECFRMHQKSSECIRMLQKASECFRLHQNVSECIRRFKNSLECFRMLQNASD